MIPEVFRAEAPPWFGLLAAVVYFLIWAAQRVLQNRTQGAPRKPGPVPGEKGTRREVEKQGTDLWKDLLEGKTVEPPKPASPPQPTPVRTKRVAQRRGPKAETPRPAKVPTRAQQPEKKPSTRPQALPPTPADPRPEPVRPPAPAPLAAFPGGPVDLPERSYESSRSAPGPKSGARPELDAAEVLGGAALFGGFQTQDWRRAIVLREVLGPPVALRRGEDAEHPWS